MNQLKRSRTIATRGVHVSHTQYVTRLGAWLNLSLGVAYCTVMVAMVLIWLIVILIYFHFCILNYHLNAEVGHQNNDYHPTLFYFYDLFIQVSIKFSGFCVEWSVTNSSYKLQSQLAVTSCLGLCPGNNAAIKYLPTKSK